MIDLTKLWKTSYNNELSLYSYYSCDNTFNDEIKQCKGLIVENSTNKILWKPSEYIDTYIERLPNINDLDTYTVHYSCEGTCLRLFNYNNRWILSTTKKLNAFESYWNSSKSFGQLFVDNLSSLYNIQYDEFLSKLDTKNLYILFLKSSNSNRIVCNSEEYNDIYHVLTLDNNGIIEEDIGIKKTEQLNIPVKLLLKFIRNIDYTKYQGIILRKNLKEIKILNKKYSNNIDIRGDVHSLKLRYLQIRTDCTKYKYFMDLYPDKIDIFKAIENKIKQVATELVELYKTRYIDEKYEYLNYLYHVLLKTVNFKLKRIGEVDINNNTLYYYFIYEISKLYPAQLNQLL